MVYGKFKKSEGDRRRPIMEGKRAREQGENPWFFGRPSFPFILRIGNQTFANTKPYIENYTPTAHTSLCPLKKGKGVTRRAAGGGGGWRACGCGCSTPRRASARRSASFLRSGCRA